MNPSAPFTHFDRQGDGPVYQRLARSIGDAIDKGHFQAGAPLPTERRLALELGLSRVTVRAAYRSLAESGLLETRAGSGNFVLGSAPPFEQPLWRLSSFSDDMAGRGRNPTSRILDLAHGEADAEESAALSLPARKRLVVRLRRLRLVDGAPLALESASLPEALVGGLELGERSLYAALAGRGLAPSTAVQRMRAVPVPMETARLLGIEAGAAAMLIERVSFLEDGRAIEFTRSHCRGDAYEFVARLDVGAF